jgi:hypothetical protein
MSSGRRAAPALPHPAPHDDNNVEEQGGGGFTAIIDVSR